MCVLGSSGAGKSTLMRCVAHLEPVDAGTISVRGRPTPRLRTARQPPARDPGSRTVPAAARNRHGLPALQPVRPSHGPRRALPVPLGRPALSG
ncbi:ATP-binding cassette domain-containing protein [Streptomyces sp. NBC_01023]|uniref:ATP-binding cassette domain-containing protein n=1 Tax=unclassified Streptomyces TaxID=2593676 RepID=UPI0030E258B8|nr:ATP-binding cassette domain-containing protein [Streptomyces sp. NBC_01023]